LAGDDGTLDNRGTMIVTAGDRGSFSVPRNNAFNNTGTVDLVSGGVSVYGDGAETGRLVLVGGTEFTIHGGTTRLDPARQLLAGARSASPEEPSMPTFRSNCLRSGLIPERSTMRGR
jgi:hypothetical protein